VGNVLRRHGVPPAPERKRTTTWPAFIRTHLALLAGTDFFTAEVLTLRGLATYYVLFFIHHENRRVDIAGITVQPDEPWMKQIARNVTMGLVARIWTCGAASMMLAASAAIASTRCSQVSRIRRMRLSQHGGDSRCCEFWIA